MTEAENLVLQHLRAIRAQLDTLNERQLEMMQRIGALEVQVANLATQMANLSVRVDRIDARLDRVERRLGLVEV
jgi:predicted  nucleic acid-binding Zn-ribbon protein